MKKINWRVCIPLLLVLAFVALVIVAKRREDTGTPVGFLAEDYITASGEKEIWDKLSRVNYFLMPRGDRDKNLDLVDLTMRTQSGQAINKLAIIPIDSCYAPDVRAGVPSTQCELSDGMGTVFIGGENPIRSRLLKIQPEQKAWAYGQVLGMYGRTPMLLVR